LVVEVPKSDILNGVRFGGEDKLRDARDLRKRVGVDINRADAGLVKCSRTLEGEV